MKYTSLASSSAGNCYIVDDGQTKLMIDCGITRGAVRKRSGCTLADFAGCLITHEHNDHSKIVPELLKSGMNVYMSEGTALALELDDGLLAMAKKVQHNVPVQIGTFHVVPFTTYHDAAEPLGFLIQSMVDGEILIHATDTVNLRYHFPAATIIGIEANFDSCILAQSTKLPKKTIHRIQNTHMEIDTLCDILRGRDLSRCREIHLLHMSDSHAAEEEFIYKVRRAVPHGIQVTAAPR